ncbi:hypothetical protein JCM6882_006708 [Rhodosporidiobolus microsporus]
MSGSTRLDELAAAVLPPSSRSSAGSSLQGAAAHDPLLPKYREGGIHRRESSVASLASTVARPGGRRRAVVVAFIVLLAGAVLLSRDERYGFEAWDTLPWRSEVDDLPPEREPLFLVEDGIVRLPTPPAPDPEPTTTAASPPLFFPTDALALPARPDPTPLPPPPPRLPSADDLAAASTGLLPISVEPSLYSFPPPSLPLHLLTFSRLPAAARWSCLDAWVGEGRVCRELEGRFAARKEDEVKIDVVWTWVNGSESRLAEWREILAEEGEKKDGKKGKKGKNGAQVLRHFREHDELRFSIRSVLSSLASSLKTLHLVSGDIPAESPSSNTSVPPPTANNRLLQVPTWLKTEQAQRVDLDSGASSSASRPQIRLHSHSELFKTRAGDGEPSADEQARRWQNTSVPSFSSRAIESQLPGLETDSPVLLSLNDDFFLLKTLSASDIASPLTGPVFRMYRNFVVEGVPANKNDKDGIESEWLGLKHSNWLLDQRFGKRKRPYLAHIAKSISAPVFREAREVFFEAFSSTASARFRGRGPNQITPLFLYTQYTVEKHREALLWSYLVARFDVDSDGFLSPQERILLLTDFLTDNAAFHQDSASLYSRTPCRSSLLSIPSTSSLLGLLSPKHTKFEFLSSDGYAHFAADNSHGETIPHWQAWPHFTAGSDVGKGLPCAMRLKSCFSEEFLNLDASAPGVKTGDALKRIAFEQPECGDCLIVHLLAKSGEQGLEAFLPAKGEEADGEELEALTVATSGTAWQDVSFSPLKSSLSRRQQALSLIQRYSYSIGSSPLAFLSVTSGGDKLSDKLAALTSRADGPAFLALNDDIGTTKEDELRDIDERMKRWFGETWTTPSEWEREHASKHRVQH